jgi:hypothetical protein
MVRYCVRLFARSGLLVVVARSGAFVKRLSGRWVVLGVCTAAIGVGVGLAVSGGPSPWSSGSRALPPARARVYENVDACLLTGAQGLSDRTAAQAWAGLEAASTATSARVSYLAVTGPATMAAAEPYAGTLLVQGCKVIVASGAAERAAALAEAGRFSSVRFVVTGAAAGSPANVTALAFTPSGLEASVASAVEAGVHAAGG